MTPENVDDVVRRLIPGKHEGRTEERRRMLGAHIAELVEHQDHRRHFALEVRAGRPTRTVACVGLRFTGENAQLVVSAEGRGFRDGTTAAALVEAITHFVFVGARRRELRVHAAPGRPWLDAALEAAGFTGRPAGKGVAFDVGVEQWRKRSRALGRARRRAREAAADLDRALADAGQRIPNAAPGRPYWPAVPRSRDASILVLVEQLSESQWWSEERLAAHQFRQAALLLDHARRTVPHYRDCLPGRSAADSPRDAESWRAIPILTRAGIQEAGAALETDALPPQHGTARPIRTSGSTGRPIEVRGTRVTGDFFSAMQTRYHLWHERDFKGRVAAIRSLTGRLAKQASGGKPMRWSSFYPSGPMVMFDITLPVSEQLEWLIGIDADYLLTFPSNLGALLELSDRSGRKPEKLRQVVTMSEIVEPKLRDACARVWNVTLVDSYSSEELGLIAAQCPEHPHYHVMSENLIVELLDDAGNPVAPGEVGRIVVTDLHNFATPLIRYEIGDYAEAGTPCPCGRGLPVINRVLGRSRNMMALPGGERFWPSLPEDRIMPVAPIRQFQVVQKSLETVEVKLAVERPLTEAEETALRDLLVDVFRHPFAIEFIYVDEIARAANGKYEDFKSEVT